MLEDEYAWLGNGGIKWKESYSYWDLCPSQLGRKNCPSFWLNRLSASSIPFPNDSHRLPSNRNFNNFFILCLVYLFMGLRLSQSLSSFKAHGLETQYKFLPKSSARLPSVFFAILLSSAPWLLFLAAFSKRDKYNSLESKEQKILISFFFLSELCIGKEERTRKGLAKRRIHYFLWINQFSHFFGTLISNPTKYS